MKQPAGVLRIIGGKWRGRRLKILDAADLRPTPDRVRETLFNWLSPIILGATCLDAFTGSGALGFEALSRGAAHVVMTDHAASHILLLKEEAAQLGADKAMIYCATLPEGLQPPEKPFQVVFLDPPYQSDLLFTCCHYLESHAYLADRAYIYLESNRLILHNELPSTWRIIKSLKAGQVVYQLAFRESEPS